MRVDIGCRLRGETRVQMRVDDVAGNGPGPIIFCSPRRMTPFNVKKQGFKARVDDMAGNSINACR